jgi:hypothetical protein
VFTFLKFIQETRERRRGGVQEHRESLYRVFNSELISG